MVGQAAICMTSSIAVSGFELRDLIEIWYSRHLLYHFVITLQQFVLFDFTLRNKSWNPLTLADVVLPRKRCQFANIVGAVTSCDELMRR